MNKMDAVEQNTQFDGLNEKSGEFVVIQVQGKHGIIEMVFPKQPPTEDERIELHRKIAEIALRTHKKKRLRRPFMDGIRFFEKYKDKLLREAYKFLYFKKRLPHLGSLS